MNLEERMNDAMKDFDKLELELYRVYFDSTFGLVQYCLDITEEHLGEDGKLMNQYILNFLLTKWAIGDELERLPVEMGRLKKFHTDLIESEFVFRLDPMVQFVRELIVVCQDEG
jgi:hypothetical protein